MGPFLLTFVYFIAAIVVVAVGLVIFELITTKYKDWHEIEAGNTAVALSIGGKIIGICLILAFSIYHSSDVLDTVIWGGYGVVLQLIAYYIFDFLTRRFSVEQKLHEGVIAVGIVSMCVSIGLGFVVGASIT
ncbi:DUF350 domain-containing protein [Guptibacillus algicola]|uniref:DUF350 domain-containing protein n=1 Tax=Guptibacillus algicola TaxID=225844 RepID=UPI001CD6BFA5|nr:DUF350 domain-containing protein [Alkalihalobacillus algicola]MCA0986343.1 DUF350 domain-containing protein [Alkalihalobacillus algicola]